MNNKKVSIIVPVYNVEKYLQRCIESILTQTETDFELLLIDDGSKDKSGLICDEYAQKDKRVNVIHKENGGGQGRIARGTFEAEEGRGKGKEVKTTVKRRKGYR